MPRLENLSALEGRVIPLGLFVFFFFLYSPITFRKRCFGEMVIGAVMQESYVFNTHVAWSSHGHVSYFYHQENIGAGLGFEQLAFLVPLLHTRARERVHKHRTFLQHCRKPPLFKISKTSTAFLFWAISCLRYAYISILNMNKQTAFL